MNRILSLIVCTLFSFAAYAQSFQIGFFSYDKALKSMPDYAIVQETVANLRTQYDAELQAAQQEFTEKYELFLEQQSKMATAIREKRQSELQLLMERNVAFRAASERLLQKAEEEGLQPLREKLDSAIQAIGSEGYIVILNTDSNACPYLNPAFTTDINALVQEKLK